MQKQVVAATGIVVSALLAAGCGAGSPASGRHSPTDTRPLVSTTTPHAPPTTVAPPVSTTAPPPSTAGAAVPKVISDCTAPPPQARQAQVEPTEIVVACADDGVGVEAVAWNTWTTTVASGRGQVWENNCTPDCADGTIGTYPATISLSDVVVTDDVPLFTMMDVVYQGAGPHGDTTDQFTLPKPPE